MSENIKPDVFDSDTDRQQNIKVDTAERRQLTVMFIDVVDSTVLCEKLDPESFFRVLTSYQNLVFEKALHYGASDIRVVGDGLLIYFGLPRAREDDAERAIHAAVSITEAFQDLEFATEELGPIKIGLRIALSTGPVVVGKLQMADGARITDVFGLSVNIASRLQQIAPPNRILINEATYSLVHGSFNLERLGPQSLKNINQPVEAWVVLGKRSAESRFERRRRLPLTTMFGRAAELQQLQDLWNGAVESTGAVVTVSGEPGIGKSRLLWDFRRRIRGTDHDILFFQGSQLHQSTPLAPLVEQIRRTSGILPTDSPKAAVSKLRQLLLRAVDDPDELIPYYGAILSVPAFNGYAPVDLGSAGVLEKTLEHLLQVTIELSKRKPLLCIIEDFQWMDPSSLDLAQRLLQRVASERIMCVVSYRSELTPQFSKDVAVNQIVLSRIDTIQQKQMISEIAEGAALPGFLMKKLVAQTDGIPLMVEELTRAVLASGSLERVEGRLKVKEAVPQPIVPLTIRDSLMERLDHLGDAKKVAQFASVFGLTFTHRGIRSMSTVPDDFLETALDQLERAGIVRRHMENRSPVFVFTHAMLQEEAYGSLLIGKRQRLHMQAADFLAKEMSASDHQRAAILAYHYSKAGRFEEAGAFWLDAAKSALRRSAHREAIANTIEGLHQLERWSDRTKAQELEIELQMHHAMAYISIEGWAGPHVLRAYERALELCRSGGSVRQRSIALFGFSRGKMVATDLEHSLNLADESLAFAESVDDVEVALMAHTSAVTSNFYLGNLEAAKKSAEYIFRHYAAAEHLPFVEHYHHDPMIVALVFGGHVYWLLGQPDKGRECCARARELAEKADHPFMTALVLSVGIADFLYDHRPEDGWKNLQQGTKHADEYGLSAYDLFAPLWMTDAVLAHDPSDAKLDDLSARISTLLRFNARLSLPFYQANTAAAYLQAGDDDTALKYIEDAVSRMAQSDEGWFKPEVYRVYGEVLAARSKGPSKDAEAFFQQALDAAAAMKAVGWEIRAAVTYGNYLQDIGDGERAASVLKQAMDSYPQGQHCEDMRRATALISGFARRLNRAAGTR
ncbi:MAG: adenylate/guanylate cyclase domain-containing protein [Pseudomonadota bacterium]